MQIHSYFLIHKDKFEKNYQFVIESAEEEAIHDMRVSIKRLRLLYKFLNRAGSAKFRSKKRIKYLDKIFQSAAKLRDTQIQIALIENAEKDLNIDLSEWKKQFAEKEQFEKEQMNRKISAVNYRKVKKQFLKAEQKINQLLEQNDFSAALDQYIANRLSKVKSLLNEDKVNYHKIRKRIKEITYLLEIKSLNNEIPSGLKIMKQTGSLLGDWHDIEIFLQEVDLKNNESVYKYLIDRQNKYIAEFDNLFSSFIQNP